MRHYHHQQRHLGAWDIPCHWKWGSNFVPKPKLVNSNSPHYQSSAQPQNASGKMSAIHLLLHIISQQRSLPFFPIFQIHILPCGIELNTLKICMWKMWNHYLRWLFYGSSFWLLVSTPYSWPCENLDVSDISLYFFKSRKWIMIYSLQDPPLPQKVSFPWCQLFDVKYEVHSCKGGDMQISNKKLLSLTWCQWIDVCCAVHY